MLMDKHQVLVIKQKILVHVILVMWNQGTGGTGTEIMKRTWIGGIKVIYEMAPQKIRDVLFDADNGK